MIDDITIIKMGHMLGLRGCATLQGVPPARVYFLRTCVLSGYTFLPILLCVLSGILSNLIVSYVFPQGIQSHAFWSYFMFSQGHGQVVRASILVPTTPPPPTPHPPVLYTYVSLCEPTPSVIKDHYMTFMEIMKRWLKI